ncbi:hypothetical protein CFC21_009324, partial [Triticum aestivum]
PLSTPVNLGVSIVPERKVFVVERLGMYHKSLSSGIHFLVPGHRPHRLRPLARGGGHPNPGQPCHHKGWHLDPDRRSAPCQDEDDASSESPRQLGGNDCS